MLRGLNCVQGNLQSLSPSDTKYNVSLLAELLACDVPCKNKMSAALESDVLSGMAGDKEINNDKFATIVKEEDVGLRTQHCGLGLKGIRDILQIVYGIRCTLDKIKKRNGNKPAKEKSTVVLRVVPPNATLPKLSLVKGEIEVVNSLLENVHVFVPLKRRIQQVERTHRPVQSSTSVSEKETFISTLSRNTPELFEAVRVELTPLVTTIVEYLVQSQVVDPLHRSVLKHIKEAVEKHVKGPEFTQDMVQVLTRCEVSLRGGQIDVNTPFPFVLKLYEDLELDITTTALLRECVRVAQQLSVRVVHTSLTDAKNQNLVPLKTSIVGGTHGDSSSSSSSTSIVKRIGMLVIGIVALVYGMRGVVGVTKTPAPPKKVDGPIAKAIDLVAKIVFVIAMLVYTRRLFKEIFENILSPDDWSLISDALLKVVLVYMVKLLYCMFMKNSPLVVYCMMI